MLDTLREALVPTVQAVEDDNVCDWIDEQDLQDYCVNVMKYLDFSSA